MFLEFITFLFMKVMQELPTQGVSTQLEVLQKLICRFASSGIACYTSSKIMKTSNFSNKMTRIDVTQYSAELFSRAPLHAAKRVQSIRQFPIPCKKK